jgi:hypothetical protein
MLKIQAFTFGKLAERQYMEIRNRKVINNAEEESLKCCTGGALT